MSALSHESWNLLRSATMFVAAVGAVALVTALFGRERRTGRSLPARARIGLVLIGVGVASSCLVRKIAATADLATTDAIRTNAPAAPKVHVSVPAGWRLEQHDELQVTIVVRGESSAQEAPTVLSVFTSHSDEDRDLNALVADVATNFKKAGYAVTEDAFDTKIAGRQAKALVMKGALDTICMWNVKLTPHDAAGIQCSC